VFWIVLDILLRRTSQNRAIRVENQTQVIKHLNAIINKSELSDIKFILEGKPFYAHKVIIAARCEYFRKMFFGGFKQSHEINIPDTKYEVFQALMEYLYTGKIKLNVGIDLQLLYIADEYQISELFSICESYIISRMEITNVVEILMAADSCPGAINLKSEAIRFTISKVRSRETSLTESKFKVLPKSLFASITQMVLQQEIVVQQTPMQLPVTDPPN